ncbi:hypothetical protein [Negadavirga shengliensis]|uniref:Uncharacterized protein n=1 Tax=Negadavirga shengliensis TaxID=1389218 RepID=A0ABV9SVI2_9BACT
MDIMQGFGMINENGFAALNGFWENDTIAFFEIRLQRNGEITNWQVFWDHNENQAVKRVFSENRFPAFKQPVGFLDGCCFYCAGIGPAGTGCKPVARGGCIGRKQWQPGVGICASLKLSYHYRKGILCVF